MRKLFNVFAKSAVESSINFAEGEILDTGKMGRVYGGDGGEDVILIPPPPPPPPPGFEP